MCWSSNNVTWNPVLIWKKLINFLLSFWFSFNKLWNSNGIPWNSINRTDRHRVSHQNLSLFLLTNEIISQFHGIPLEFHEFEMNSSFGIPWNYEYTGIPGFFRKYCRVVAIDRLPSFLDFHWISSFLPKLTQLVSWLPKSK